MLDLWLGRSLVGRIFKKFEFSTRLCPWHKDNGTWVFLRALTHACCAHGCARTEHHSLPPHQFPALNPALDVFLELLSCWLGHVYAWLLIWFNAEISETF